MTVKVNRYNLVAARWRKGYKQGELARIAGISQKYLSDIETGRCGVSPNVAKRLADSLGVAVDDIVEFEEPAARV